MKNFNFIYWFYYYNDYSASVRYRGIYPLEYLNKKYRIKYITFTPNKSLKSIFIFLKLYFSILFFRKKNSLIVIQRIHSKFLYASLLKLLIIIRNKNTIYDIDDADYLITNPSTIYFFSKKCMYLTVGSDKILEHLSVYNNPTFLTSPIVDLGIYKTQKNNLLTIGWIGDFGGDHKNSLYKNVFPAIKNLDIEIKLVILGIKNKFELTELKTYFRNNNNIKLEAPIEINWTDETYIQKTICQFDVGIANLDETPIHLSKSGIKAKQYLNNGVPVLSSDLKENNKYVIDGYNGFLCKSQHDFLNKIIHIYSMSNDEYMKLSNNSKKSIVNFNHEYYWQTIDNMIGKF